MFESPKAKDKLTVVIDRDGEIETIYPKCSLSLFDRIVGFFRGTPCTGDLVVNAGITDMATYIKDNFTVAAYGSGSTAPAVGQTALVTEIARKMVDTATLTTTTLANDTAHFEVQFKFGISKISI